MSTASWTCVQYVHHSPVRQPAGAPPLVDTAINERLWQVVIHKYIIKYQQNHNQTILV